MYDVCTARHSDVYSWFSRQCLSKALWFPFKEQSLWDWDFSLKAQSPTSCSDSALLLFPPFLIFLPPLILPLSAFIYLTTPSKKITCSYNSASWFSFHVLSSVKDTNIFASTILHYSLNSVMNFNKMLSLLQKTDRQLLLVHSFVHQFGPPVCII